MKFLCGACIAESAFLSALIGKNVTTTRRCERCWIDTRCVDMEGLVDPGFQPASAKLKREVYALERLGINTRCSQYQYSAYRIERKGGRFSNWLQPFAPDPRAPWIILRVESDQPLDFAVLYSWESLRIWSVWVNNRRMPRLRSKGKAHG